MPLLMSGIFSFFYPRLIWPDLNVIFVRGKNIVYKFCLKTYKFCLKVIIILLVGKFSVLGNFSGQNTFSKIVALIV